MTDGFIVVFRFFFLHPPDKGGNLFVLLQPLNGVVMSLQLHFGEHRMNFIVTDFVQQDCGGAPAAFAQGQQVMPVVRRRQFPSAQRTIVYAIGLHASFLFKKCTCCHQATAEHWHCFFSNGSMTKVRKQEKRFFLTVMLSLFRGAFQKLLHNDPLRMAGATAFFTSFALPFILIILSQILGLFYDVTKVRSQLFQTLAGAFGRDAMQQVASVLRAFRQLANNPLITLLGILFLFLVSTTLLMVIKSSINQLWRIKVVHGRSFWQKLGIRLQSVLIILGTAILFFLSILAEGLKAYLDHTITNVLPAFTRQFMGVLNYGLSVVFVTLWFAIIFRLLPDARVPWKVALTGAFVTSVLFNLGKYILRVLLVNSNLNSLYGASASVVLLLLFVFYASLILYFGVAFTRVWADYIQAPIRPLPYATHYKVEDTNENA